MTPAKYDIYADRYVAFTNDFKFLAKDLTGASFRAQVRQNWNESGAALVSLTTQTTNVQGLRLTYAGTDTVANHIAAGRLSAVPTGFVDTDNLLLSIVHMRIDAGTMSPLPVTGDSDNEGDLVWDFLLTELGALEARYFYGQFIVRPGGTH